MVEMTPQPTMPTPRSFIGLSKAPNSLPLGHGRVSAAREPCDIVGLVVLGHKLRHADLLEPRQQYRPVEHPKARIGPAVLIHASPRRRDVLDVDGLDPTGIALQLGDRIGTAAHRPGDVGLPQQLRRLLQQDVDVALAIRSLGVLPMVVMPAELQAFGGDDLSNPIEFASERSPLGLATIAFARRRRRGVDRLNSEVSAHADRSNRIGAQPIEADMRSRCGHAVPLKLALELLRIAEKSAKRFDLLVAESGEQFELSLQRLKRAGGVELKREAFNGRHGHSLTIRRLQSAP